MKTFEQLYAELADKAVARPEGSGTVAALDAGVHAIGKKIIEEAAEVKVDVLSEEDEGRFAFIGATKSLGHPVEGRIAVVDVGGGSSEVIFGSVAGGVEKVRSFKVGSGSLVEELLGGERRVGARC